MKSPEKNIPRAIHASMAIVSVSGSLHACWYGLTCTSSWQVLFLLANLAYFVVLDKVFVSVD